MRTPGVLTCDLCGAVIKDEQRRIHLHVPLTADLLERVFAELAAPPVASGAVMAITTMRRPPSHWEVDVCGCILGLLPMLPDIVTREVTRELANQQEHRAAALEPLRRLDDL
jgi:hypothetical protein